jgi:small subunit ribosomal protein S6
MAKTYETICIFKPETSEEKVNSVVAKVQAKIESLGGKVDKIENWGAKKVLISPKKNKIFKDGNYVMIYFTAEPSVPAQVKNILQVTEDLVKFLVVVSAGLPAEAPSAPAAASEEKVEISPSMLGA